MFREQRRKKTRTWGQENSILDLVVTIFGVSPRTLHRHGCGHDRKWFLPHLLVPIFLSRKPMPRLELFLLLVVVLVFLRVFSVSWSELLFGG